ncbi:programmed cell death protein 2 [Cylas formicarius]|uniref:programmed cell death protein 2 n=1 Tax=Cylas formicarius TaxID=197179 RepID=UPI00295867FE|nr:programmed cell death protein 2 [Cylas formicarius]
MSIELGFLEESDSWKLESRLFPSKVGGKPAWLSLEKLPKFEDLQCPECKCIMIFLCQIYAPYERELIDVNTLANNFHRTLFVFVCRNSLCCENNNSKNIKVFRSTLPRDNKFYSYIPPEEKPDESFSLLKWVELCNICGCFAEKKCSKCKQVYYCCREHQICDWKEGHKLSCLKDITTQYKSNMLFTEWEVATITEETETKVINEGVELKKFDRMKAEGRTGTLAGVSEYELDAHVSHSEDKIFSNFKKKISEYPDQVIRYCRGGQPLFIAKEPVPDAIPNCEYCGAKRQFEFQIMPQMITLLKEDSVDWGILLIYTCQNSCIGDSLYSYKKEFVFKQDILNEQ